MVSTNNRLRLDECTNAVLRRLAILPFDYEYVDVLDSDEKKKQRLKDVNLLRELETPKAREAIFAWAVEGAKVYFAAGQHVAPEREEVARRRGGRPCVDGIQPPRQCRRSRAAHRRNRSHCLKSERSRKRTCTTDHPAPRRTGHPLHR